MRWDYPVTVICRLCGHRDTHTVTVHGHDWYEDRRAMTDAMNGTFTCPRHGELDQPEARRDWSFGEPPPRWTAALGPMRRWRRQGTGPSIRAYPRRRG